MVLFGIFFFGGGGGGGVGMVLYDRCYSKSGHFVIQNRYYTSIV